MSGPRWVGNTQAQSRVGGSFQRAEVVGREEGTQEGRKEGREEGRKGVKKLTC